MGSCYWKRWETTMLLLAVCLFYAICVRGQSGHSNLLTTIGSPQFKIGTPPPPPILPEVQVSFTPNGAVITTDVYGIKTYNNTNVTYKMIVSDVTDYVCGSKSICNRTHNDSTIKELCTFDCTNCKCDEKCHFYGDCCARKLFEYSSTVPSYRPGYVTCTGSANFSWDGEPHIFMVTKCPEHTVVNKSVHSKCVSPDLTRLSEATPVSDMSSQITYANKYCAACHNIHEYRAWSQRVKCPFVKTLKNATTREELWALVITDKSCTKDILPPANMEVRVCYPYTHGNCNVTGEWTEHVTPLTEILCDLYDHTVDYFGSTATPVAYKNIFCAICNGASLQKFPFCKRQQPEIPSPLSVLLQFNPSEETDLDGSRSSYNCPTGQMFDPFSGACQNFNCPPRRILLDGECSIPYLICSGLGFSYKQELRPDYESIVNTTGFLEDYATYFNAFFYDFEPIVFKDVEINFYSKAENTSSDVYIVLVAGHFISNSEECGLQQVESHIQQFLSTSWTSSTNNQTLVSSDIGCPDDGSLGDQYQLLSTQNYHYKNEIVGNTGLQGSFSPAGLQCPFLEYDMSFANFTYDSEKGTILYNGKEIYLNTSGVSFCNDTLKICSDVILEINDVLLVSDITAPQTVTSNDPILPIVSTVCMCLSLACLFLTFVTFCLVAKLRTAPGKNTMALVLHLFMAQLFFLSLTNRVEIKPLCQAFAILIHYLWLTTFTWMMGLAYQMHRVFANFPSMARNDSKNKTVVWKYLLICDLTAMIPVIVCIAYYQITSEATDLGYGRTLCFLNDAWAVGVFFTGPLCLMLAFNGFCFTRTILTVGCRQKLENATANSNINFLFIYIKMSILFGFSWTFGLLAAIFDSITLWYIFVLLTGSQGIFMFISYCANKKIWTTFKRSLSQRSSTLSSRLSRNSS